jgi:hypothetical protein
MIVDACVELAKREIQVDESERVEVDKNERLRILLSSLSQKHSWFKVSSPVSQIIARLKTQSQARRAKPKSRKTLIAVGTYTIGKERLFKGQQHHPTPPVLRAVLIWAWGC